MNTSALRVAVAVTVAVIALAVSLALSLVVFNVVEIPLGKVDGSGSGITVGSSLITLAVAATIMLLLAITLAIGLDDYWSERPLSPLYPPLLLLIVALAAMFLLAAVEGVDRIAHDLLIGWHWTDEPEALAMGSAFRLIVLGAVSWSIVLILRGRNWLTRELILLFIAVGSIASFAAVVPFALTR